MLVLAITAFITSILQIRKKESGFTKFYKVKEVELKFNLSNFPKTLSITGK